MPEDRILSERYPNTRQGRDCWWDRWRCIVETGSRSLGRGAARGRHWDECRPKRRNPASGWMIVVDATLRIPGLIPPGGKSRFGKSGRRIAALAWRWLDVRIVLTVKLARV